MVNDLDFDGMNDGLESDNNQNTPPAGPLQHPPAAEAVGGKPRTHCSMNGETISGRITAGG